MQILNPKPLNPKPLNSPLSCRVAGKLLTYDFPETSCASKRRMIVGIVLGLYRDDGNENGSCYSIMGLNRDNGKENGNYYLWFPLNQVYSSAI